MKYMLLILAVVTLSGCGPSVQTAFKSDPDLVNNFAGKKVGISGIYRTFPDEDTPQAKKLNNIVFQGVSRNFFKSSNLEGKVYGKLVQVSEEDILGADKPLILFYDYIQNMQNLDSVRLNSQTLKNELLKNDIDCLILYTAGSVTAQTTDVNWFKFAEFGLRMANAATGGVSSPGSGGSFSKSGSPKTQSVVLYTCGDKPLYIGGASGDSTGEPKEAARALFARIATGSKE